MATRRAISSERNPSVWPERSRIARSGAASRCGGAAPADAGNRAALDRVPPAADQSTSLGASPRERGVALGERGA
jgi:hypothetical protein